MKSVKRLRLALQDAGLDASVENLPASTRTATEAATAIGCSVGEIAKSLVFGNSVRQEPVLVVMSGPNRVDLTLLQALLASPVEQVDAEYVRRHTGYSIGGVPPLGHSKPIQTFLDEDLFQYETIWAAAGGPYSVFPVSPRELERAIGAKRARLVERTQK